MSSILIKSAHIVNEGETFVGDVYIENGQIQQIAKGGGLDKAAEREINAEGLHLLPGLIDDQVHFREPGLTHKADIWHESRAAVAGGTTSYMEMPNTVPNTLTQDLLEAKYRIAAKSSLANYSFYMGASNDNLEEVLRTDPRQVCGIKVFMGSSTGNMLVDDEKTLEGIFSQAPMLVATHCEDEATIRKNLATLQAQHSVEDFDASMHPLIRSAEACYLSSSRAVALAKMHNTRLHVLHISTAREVELFEAEVPLPQKRITAEACVHHLWFSDADYAVLGNRIKWNPAVKSAEDRAGVLAGLLAGKIDVLATDHAPHTLEEKSRPYLEAPSGGPLVQFALQALLDLCASGKMTVEQVVEKGAHNPAVCFQIDRRGYIREGYWADLVLVDLQKPYLVTSERILSKCAWSPFEGHTFQSSIAYTLVNGSIVFEAGQIRESPTAQRLLFQR